MKIIKTASGKKTLKLSKREWQDIGKKAGWMRESDENKMQVIHPSSFDDEGFSSHIRNKMMKRFMGNFYKLMQSYDGYDGKDTYYEMEPEIESFLSKVVERLMNEDSFKDFIESHYGEDIKNS